eukprot:TRINITY_DN16067_c0_g1_i1.p1 TRINITY_DN16067_c0_g1~~TRINITY_DN16067_c0_g1_i1.p1  ORF type:complete len:140 (+),score=37.78 TRINITY_DN16067_c0_g1_i1:56-475(+)
MSDSAISGVSFSLKTRRAVKTGDDDLLDEDAMLTEADKEKKVAVAGSDCRTRKKACANCTCGRAEEEQLERAQADSAEKKVEPPKEKVILKDGDAMPFMGCGSCTKGDAFRCASCPFLGQPAFKENAEGKVKLDLNDDF